MRQVIVTLTDEMSDALAILREPRESDAEVLTRGLGALVREQAGEATAIPFVEVKPPASDLSFASARSWFKRMTWGWPAASACICETVGNHAAETKQRLGVVTHFCCPVHGDMRR